MQTKEWWKEQFRYNPDPNIVKRTDEKTKEWNTYWINKWRSLRGKPPLETQIYDTNEIEFNETDPLELDFNIEEENLSAVIFEKSDWRKKMKSNIGRGLGLQ